MPYFKNYEHPYFFTHKSIPLPEHDAEAIERMYMAVFVTSPESMVFPEVMELIELSPNDRDRADESVRLALLFNIPLEEAEVI